MKLSILFLMFIWIVIPCAIQGGAINPKKLAQKARDGHFETGDEGQADFDKEVLWGEGDDDDDDEIDILDLPEEEQKEKLKHLVEKKMDKDQDGKLTLEEIQLWAERSFDAFETEESRTEFPDIDLDNDGLMIWDEIAIDRYGEYNEESDEYKNPSNDEWKDFKKTYEKDKKHFKAADIDNSGGLTMEEYMFFKHPRLHENTKKIAIEDAFEKSDLNKDGQIDMNEYLGDYKVPGDTDEPEWVAMDREKFSSDFDKNKDGVLTGDEILEWIAPSNAESAQEEAEHLLDECDENKDGYLTPDEIVNNHDLWIESDATDYGQQLLKHHDEL